jgi:hypothetical protein
MYLDDRGDVVIEDDELELCLAVCRALGLTDEQLERMPEALCQEAQMLADQARWQ